MPRNFNLPSTLSLKDPRFAMRLLIGVLLAANLVTAIVAFKPFGGSAEDVRREQQSLNAQLTRAQQQLANSRQLVDKVQRARAEGDQFLSKYFTDPGTTGVMIVSELTTTAREAGIQMGPAQFTPEPVVGSENLDKLSSNVGFAGNYANFTKFVNLLDKSPRFVIIENLQASAPQQGGGQTLAVSLKIDTFVKNTPGATP
jgi:Tfp pilus assembly protein PilO